MEQCCRAAALLVVASLVFVGSAYARMHPVRHERQRYRRQYGFRQSISLGLDSEVEESGPWGPWTESSECSRSCGGGVAFQTRICLDVRIDGSHTCKGPSKRYFSCNIQDCPEYSGDFREEQCSRFNTVPFDGKYYSWVPYLKAPNPCELNCMPKGEKFYFRHARKVIDGTRCYDDGSLDVCVDGICMPVGCDMMLGSTVKEDKCRECGGDGSSCRTVEGVFDVDNLEVGYNDILLIPAGATNIRIREKYATNNYLAIRNLTGHFYLNGNWRIEFPRELKFAGTTFHYERKPHGFLAPESIRAIGPTSIALFMVLLYQEKNLGIEYEYSVPVGVSAHAPDTYSWTFGDYGECSQTCGGGVQLRPVSCVQSSDLEPVEEQLCDASVKPPPNRTCNAEPCPASWFVGDWDECSKSCGGLQTRLVYCREVISGDISAVTKDSNCEKDGPKPTVVRECNLDPDCQEGPSTPGSTPGTESPYQWDAGDWTECSNPCGGVQTREVTCVQTTDDGKTAKVDEEKCKAIKPKPENVKQCKADCLNSTHGPVFEDETPHWIAQDWTECSKPCNGIQSRTVVCVLVLNEEAAAIKLDEECEKTEPKPEDTKECNVQEHCPQWEAGEWSECDEPCGPGQQTREVTCQLKTNFESDLPSEVEDSQCDLELKPETTQSCFVTPCEGVEWMLSDWTGTCDNGCGVNMQFRQAFCSNEKGKIYPDVMCDSERLPNLTRPCENTTCDDALWHASEWSECSAKCGTGIKTRHVFCGVWESDSILKIDDSNCNADTKPLTTDNCTLDPCEGIWFTGPWDRCSSPCGGGYRTRKLLCLHEEKVIPNSRCDVSSKPLSKEDCNVHPCDEDEMMVVGGCKKTRHGCCPDGMTPAGPNYIGCPKPEKLPEGECRKTEFGCCIDGLTPALGPYRKGCPPLISCNKTKHGCCIDGVTAAKGPDGEGCPEYLDCSLSLWGCCPDNVTAASGTNFTGCDLGNVTCEDSEYGCCPDGITAAEGSGGVGCDIASGEDCVDSMFGCCPDGMTPAMSEDMEGCPDQPTISTPGDCINSTYGCCPDNMTIARGPDEEGCDKWEGSGDLLPECTFMPYGCCPDNETAAEGPDSEGCDLVTSNVTLPDDYTDATSEDDFSTSNETSSEEPYSTSSEEDSMSNETSSEEPDYTSLEDLTSEDLNITTTEVGPSLSTVTTTEEEVDCHNQVYGCCPDGVSPAFGPNDEGCCYTTKYGCCPDNSTAALGPDNLGCGCQTYPYGCCPDGITPASGPRLSGCTCEQFPYGCCQDKYTPARGPNFDGCLCERMVYGCCPDGVTPAIGPRLQGCTCKNTVHGCCPDGRTPALGERFQGCPCSAMHYGCCADGVTAARGPDQQGCPCESTQYGCCPDGHTSAGGPNNEGCECRGTVYGCCPDGRTPARGRDYSGCPCDTHRYGCCPDRRTPAKGPRYQGCPCTGSPFGCCPDGVSVAFGPNKEGCPSVSPTEKPPVVGEVCQLPKDPGSCSNYTVKWFFDMSYGGCSRFWYGGCDGNQNRFSTQEQCESACVAPEGSGVCLLPKVTGPCPGTYQAWYYDTTTSSCESFNYGGCLGNNNRFSTKQECENICQKKQVLDVCDQPADAGPCREPVARWHYNRTLGRCKQFLYGGCQGNENNFETEQECQQRCTSPPVDEKVTKDVCALPKAEGPCGSAIPRWYYNSARKQCDQFYYGGCEGNANRFESRLDCERACNVPHEGESDACQQPIEVGNCYNFHERWYFDYNDRQCHRFYYSGCGGNDNNFGSFFECDQRCSRDASTEIPDEEFKTEFCFLPQEIGPCTGSETKWYYDKNDGVCKEFNYGGCYGNGNRFRSRKECEAKCGNSQDICRLPRVQGPCSGSFIQWYYDAEMDSCKEFPYSGCQGNGNRFNDKESCMQRCWRGTEKATPSPVDICQLPQDPGPCLGAIPQWYYDTKEKQCKSMIYGGCEGNGNRFDTQLDCEQLCISDGEPHFPSEVTSRKPVKPVITDDTSDPLQTVCRMPSQPGPCDESHARWFYDPESQTCLPFIYTGCGGNKNRFKNFEICMRFCSGVQSAGQPKEDDLTKPEMTKAPCPPSNCDVIRCPFGMDEKVDGNGCITCHCSNPCQVHTCAEGMLCAVEVYRTSDGEPRAQPVCRLKVKPGVCPNMKDWLGDQPQTVSKPECVDRCRTDADCAKEQKCCFNGCAHRCMDPEEEVLEQDSTTIDPHKSGVSFVPDSPEEAVVTTKVGSEATVRCPVGGRSSVMTWSKEGQVIQYHHKRYRILPDGSLQIMSVEASDAGTYACVADVGHGKTTTRFIKLVVHAPVRFIPGPRVVIVRLGYPTILQCNAVGYPVPVVTWWRGSTMLPLSSSRFEQFSNYSLLIRSVTRQDHGLYTCQAYNGIGPLGIWEVTVVLDFPQPRRIAIRPYRRNGPHLSGSPRIPKGIAGSEYNDTIETGEDELVDEGADDSLPRNHLERGESVESLHADISPSELPENLFSTFEAATLTPVVHEDLSVRVYIVTPEYYVGAPLQLDCHVEGKPQPVVFWYFENSSIPIVGDEHRKLLENNTLYIERAKSSDSGEYKCTAKNHFEESSASVSIKIEDIYLPPECTDSPFFANCDLIIKAKYCDNSYYAKFCCRSCMLAGQLKRINK